MSRVYRQVRHLQVCVQTQPMSDRWPKSHTDIGVGSQTVQCMFRSAELQHVSLTVQMRTHMSDRQTDRQTDSQTASQTDRQTDR